MLSGELKKVSEEDGRSMIEMLGVLAIIGILSITALTGFTYAIDTYKSNTTMTDINLLAMDFSRQMLRSLNNPVGKILVSDEFGSVTTLGYNVSARVAQNNNFFEVILDSVPSSVCDKILRVYTFPTEMYAGEVKAVPGNEDDICKGNPQMRFVFWKEFQADMP